MRVDYDEFVKSPNRGVPASDFNDIIFTTLRVYEQLPIDVQCALSEDEPPEPLREWFSTLVYLTELTKELGAEMDFDAGSDEEMDAALDEMFRDLPTDRDDTEPLTPVKPEDEVDREDLF